MELIFNIFIAFLIGSSAFMFGFILGNKDK